MRKPPNRLLCVSGAVVAALFCIYVNAAKSDVQVNIAPDAIQRITALENRVAELEKRLADQALFQYQRPTPAISDSLGNLLPTPTPPQASPGIPPGSIPHQFNGSTYYIIPLTKGAPQ
jgi:hypothetical protein